MNNTLTTNGAGAFTDTGDSLTTLFFNIGASRNNLEGIRKDFSKAVKANPFYATAILLFARDIRHNGAGERQVFKTLLTDLSKTQSDLTYKVLNLIPLIGRFDDLKSLYGTPFENYAVQLWAREIAVGNVLAAKWAKREDKLLQKALGMNEAKLRKTLAHLRKEHIVETKMCQKQFGLISYDKLPSVAGMRYANAFRKNDEARYTAFIDSKETKVNASAAFPHDVYRMCMIADQAASADKYWAALPDLELDGSILPVSDVSGSMMCAASGKLTCMDISISLGVYLSQRCKGPFQNTMLTFSEKPNLVTLPKGNIADIFNYVRRMDWGGSTNIEATYDLVLKKAVQTNATQDQMPKYILILSDMQFNQCNGQQTYDYAKRQWVQGKGIETIYQNMTRKFAAAGYKMPKIIFWNLNASFGNVPVTADEAGTGLVSGFSPNVLKAVLAAKDVTPKSIMLEAIEPFVEMLS